MINGLKTSQNYLKQMSVVTDLNRAVGITYELNTTSFSTETVKGQQPCGKNIHRSQGKLKRSLFH